MAGFFPRLIIIGCADSIREDQRKMRRLFVFTQLIMDNNNQESQANITICRPVVHPVHLVHVITWLELLEERG